jgi:hypothetical protein
MGGWCSGAVWGVGARDNDHPLFCPRTQDLRLADWGAPGGGWFLWEGNSEVVHGRDDSTLEWWCGAPVGGDTEAASAWQCTVWRTARHATFVEEHEEEIRHARARWARFRAYCKERADYDPGEGELWFVQGEF